MKTFVATFRMTGLLQSIIIFRTLTSILVETKGNGKTGKQNGTHRRDFAESLFSGLGGFSDFPFIDYSMVPYSRSPIFHVS